MAANEQEDKPSEFSSLMSRWKREKNISLNLKYWRLLIEAQTDPAHERATIDVAATWRKGWRADAIFVGGARERLEDLPITLQILKANAVIATEIAASNEKRKTELPADSKEHTEFVGWLNYYPASEYAGDNSGSIYAKVVLPAESFDYLRTNIINAATPEVGMEMVVRFPSEESEWDGKGMIDISGFTVALPHNCYPNFEPFDEPLDDNDEVAADTAALQLAASNVIAGNLKIIQTTIIMATAAIVAAIIFG
jgi:hypothetical protein